MLDIFGEVNCGLTLSVYLLEGNMSNPVHYILVIPAFADIFVYLFIHFRIGMLYTPSMSWIHDLELIGSLIAKSHLVQCEVVLVDYLCLDNIGAYFVWLPVSFSHSSLLNSRNLSLSVTEFDGISYYQMIQLKRASRRQKKAYHYYQMVQLKRLSRRQKNSLHGIFLHHVCLNHFTFYWHAMFFATVGLILFLLAMQDKKNVHWNWTQ